MNVLMDQSYETTALEMGGGGGWGGSRANVHCIYFYMVPQGGGNVRDLLYLGEHDSEM